MYPMRATAGKASSSPSETTLSTDNKRRVGLLSSYPAILFKPMDRLYPLTFEIDVSGCASPLSWPWDVLAVTGSKEVEAAEPLARRAASCSRWLSSGPVASLCPRRLSARGSGTALKMRDGSRGARRGRHKSRCERDGPGRRFLKAPAESIAVVLGLVSARADYPRRRSTTAQMFFAMLYKSTFKSKTRNASTMQVFCLEHGLVRRCTAKRSGLCGKPCWIARRQRLLWCFQFAAAKYTCLLYTAQEETVYRMRSTVAAAQNTAAPAQAQSPSIRQRIASGVVSTFTACSILTSSEAICAQEGIRSAWIPAPAIYQFLCDGRRSLFRV